MRRHLLPHHLGRARTSTTHIDNLTHAISLALTTGAPGEAYFILDAGERSMRDIIGGMATARGLTLRDNSISAGMADFLGGTMEFAWRTFGLKGAPMLTRHAAMVMSRDCVLKGDKAKRDLGYQPVISVEQGLQRLAA